METIELKVDGMTCGGCAAAVTKALGRLPGVDAVQVDLASGSARITADQAARRAPAFVEALAAAGYAADLPTGCVTAPSTAAGSTGTALSASGPASRDDRATRGRGGCCCRG